MTTTLPAHAFDPLTPVSFLQRSGAVFPDRLAVVDGDVRLTYGELLARSRRLAGMVRAAGAQPGDRVAFLARNSHQLLEAHYGLAMAGVVLVALNTRLAAAEIAHVVDAAGPLLVVADDALHGTAEEALGRADRDGVELLDLATYEERLQAADELDEPVTDEGSLISLNYTSGTTGTPKGVMYHHRGAYLQALAMLVHSRMDAHSAYLWTLPMFHCNGWAFTWAVTAAGGVHVCLPDLDGEEAWRLVDEEQVTHFCAAPTVLTMLAQADAAAPVEGRRIKGFTGGAPPTPTILEEFEGLNIDVDHLYGLTETYGPAVVCEWWPEWDSRPVGERAELMSRQGVPNVLAGGMRVVDEHGADVPRDAETMGEIQLRGNNVMLGYLDDPEATEEATADGWFRTGDLAVVHQDGYAEIRDRSKDIIVSGGENISSIEVEKVLARHPAVLEAAVVGVPDERWGERPRAHVVLRGGAEATEDELRDHVRDQLAGFKVPDEVVFGELPKTSTGKVQKHELRPD